MKTRTLIKSGYRVFLLTAIAALAVLLGVFFTSLRLKLFAAQYPTAQLTSTSGLAYSLRACSGSSKNGIYLYGDRLYLTEDTILQVDKWYREHGWQDFMIKGNPVGLSASPGLNFGIFSINALHRVYYNADDSLTKINSDVQIFFCPQD